MEIYHAREQPASSCARVSECCAICRGLFEWDRHLRSPTSIQNGNAVYADTCLNNSEKSYHRNTPFNERESDLIHTTMPPAKKVVPPEDSRSDASTVRERQIAAAAHARKSKQNAAAAAAAKDNGSLALKELAAVSAETGREGPGVSRIIPRAHCAHA